MPAHNVRCGLLLSTCALAVATAAGCAHLPYVLTENQDKIVAIDVALQPDIAVTGRTETMREPITLVRTFVRASEVHLISSQVAFVMSTTRLQDLNLRPSTYRAGTWNGVQGTALMLADSQDLRRLEERMVEALRPFTLDPEEAESFIATPDGTPMNDDTIDAIEDYIGEASGVNYRPHMLIADAKTAQQPVESLSIRSVGAVIYQLGSRGAAPRVLWTWTGEIGAR